ncbi:hypothetical protein BJY52DRAFT_1418559 [Lactarius psammicola]|nr:hypothetical protein BJY52DRAFT_1418559 [Lactarius psammicola]
MQSSEEEESPWVEDNDPYITQRQSGLASSQVSQPQAATPTAYPSAKKPRCKKLLRRASRALAHAQFWEIVNQRAAVRFADLVDEEPTALHEADADALYVNQKLQENLKYHVCMAIPFRSRTLTSQTPLEGFKAFLCQHPAHSVTASRLGHIDLLLHLAASLAVPSSINIYGTTVVYAAAVDVQPELSGYVRPYVMVLLGGHVLTEALLVCADGIQRTLCPHRLEQEATLIYPAPWTVVKVAYIICRYYTMAIAPFHLWGVVGNHEQHIYVVSTMKKMVLAVLSITFFGLVGYIVWVMIKHLSLSPMFIIAKRSGCFAVSNQPTFGVVSGANAVPGVSKVHVPVAHHLGVLTTFFDCLNMIIVVRHYVQRGTLGPLGQSILKQGRSWRSSYLVHQGLGSSSSFSYILPSALSCRLVLMLRRKASPTETELRIEHSHMVNEALEMMAMKWHPEEVLEGPIPSISTNDEAQP